MSGTRLVHAIAVAASLFFGAARATAQPGSPTVGARVRVTTSEGLVLVGKVLPAGPDTLRLLTEGITEWTFVASQLRGYETSVGHSYAQGIGWGALVGAAIGAGVIVWGEVAQKHNPDATFPAIVFTLPAALVTTVLGAGLGAAAAPEQWRSQGGLSLRVSPEQASIGVRIALGH